MSPIAIFYHLQIFHLIKVLNQFCLWSAKERVNGTPILFNKVCDSFRINDSCSQQYGVPSHHKHSQKADSRSFSSGTETPLFFPFPYSNLYSYLFQILLNSKSAFCHFTLVEQHSSSRF